MTFLKPDIANAQLYFCSAGGGPGAECTYSGTDGSCTIPPCASGDCCLQNYQSTGTCPAALTCSTTPPPPPPPPGPLCPAGQICTGLDAGTCAGAGGTPTSCSSASGGGGTCCLPDSGGTTTPTPNPGGNAGAGEYLCEWNGVNCYTNLTTELNNCPANFGRCTSGMSGCVPCEASSMQNESSCLNGNPRQCIEQNETIGYWCGGVAVGCQPCFEGDTNVECNPPGYSSYFTCNPVCTGASPIRWGCVNGECVESENGFESVMECSQWCDLPEVFCVSNDPSQRTSNTASGRYATAIGCLKTLLDGSNPNFTEVATMFLTYGLGIGGGIALILIFYAGFLIMTSSGNPKRVASGKELMGAAISGLLMLLFVGFILRFIGVQIFGLDRFGLTGGDKGGFSMTK